MRVCLFEERPELFEPLSQTRPVFDLKCGISSLSSRLFRYFQARESGVLLRPYLAEWYRQQYPQQAVNDWNWLGQGPVVLANGLWLPPETPAHLDPLPHVGLVGNDLAYVQAGPEQVGRLSVENFAKTLSEWKQTLPGRPAGGHMVHFPWDLVDQNGAQIDRDFTASLAVSRGLVKPSLAVIGPAERVHVDATATIEPYVVADATRGPVVIDEGAIVAAFTRLEGPCYLGAHTQVFGAKIRAGTSLGPHCRIGGEVEASIVHGHTNKYHDGFLGHSYVGEWVNLGAGTHTSDLRVDYGPVSVVIDRHSYATGRSKIGCYMGDHVKTGLGTLINTGSNIGTFCNLFPAGSLTPKFVPAFASWAHGKLTEGFSLEMLLATAMEVMHRRQGELTDAHRRLYAHLFEATAPTRQIVLCEAEKRQIRSA